MEAENAVSQHAPDAAAAGPAVAETEVLEVSVDDVEVVVGADEEKLENTEGGGDEQGGVAVSVARAGEAVFLPREREGARENSSQGRPRDNSSWRCRRIPPRRRSGEEAALGAPASGKLWLLLLGQFTIIHLNGSHTYDEERGGKICLLSVQLANSDGRFYGGAVGSSLIAAGPTQLIIGTFRQKPRHQVDTRPHRFASPGPSQPDQKRKTTDAKGKGALVIDPPVVPDDPPVTDEVAVQKGKAPADRASRAAPQPSSAGAATSDDVDGDGDGDGDEE
ncbi:UNVERIFIED_CONTAM: AT-hook motif nuclear-localized protein 14 [Sesamum radiatum]|uniref:AT-hook motif nuclear-localized protein n=1 Tax=Sesamum radiatum TaxID=300843 RepID=A0AAW2W4I5_SESRA